MLLAAPTRPMPALALLLQFIAGVDAMQETSQERAMHAGGFAACGAALALEELAGTTLAGCLYRGMALQVGGAG